MSQCARVLAVLKDGQPHKMRDIHRVAGFMRLNSRISDLRKRGYDISCWREGDEYLYQLVSAPLSAAATDPAPQLVSPAAALSGAPRGSTTAETPEPAPLSNQPSLFDFVRGAYDDEWRAA